jgi:ribosome maturation factor RimP
MIDTKKIIEAAERKLQGTDMFVVGCTCTPGNEIELLIDSDTSVAIEACAELSRAVEAEFDRDEEDFSLTVASAGIGSELKSLRQYPEIMKYAMADEVMRQLCAETYAKVFHLLVSMNQYLWPIT